jgi:hypothetical protein
MPTDVLTSEYWEREKRRLFGDLLPPLERIAMAGAAASQEKLRQLGISFDDDLVNAEAARWARQHAGELVDLMTETSQNTVGEIVANWIETPGATIGDLTNRLTPVLKDNAERGFTVAVTETTNSFTAGEAVTMEAAGIPPMVFRPSAHPRCRCWPSVKRLKDGTWVVIWQTNRDEVVCKRPIETPWGTVEGCGALQNVVISEGPYLGRKWTEI